MKRNIKFIYILPVLVVLLSGCSSIGNKTSSLIIVYSVTAILSLIALILYCSLINPKDIWFLLLFSAIFVVNMGYFSLAISKTLEEALLANRISYLGSVFLPMSMLMIIIRTTKIDYGKILPAILLGIGIFVFIIAATPGYSDIYYKEVTTEVINGVTTLRKIYGSWHCLYLYYLIGYFFSMIAVAIYAVVKKKLTSATQTVILILAVFINLIVWLLEQLVQIEFEILSISYIICSLFLISLQMMIQEHERISHNTSFDIVSSEDTISEFKPEAPSKSEVSPAPETSSESEMTYEFDQTIDDLAERLEQYQIGFSELTKTEKIIYEYYLSGASTKEILSLLNIKENTLKYHNKNIYSKLGVNSRRQLLELYKILSKQTKDEG